MNTELVSIKDASALTQKPERTLLEHLARGVLTGKKLGRNWVIDLATLKNSGLAKILPPQHIAT
ncbi:MAG: hypothetical protein SGI74_03560 [Oligoflexia bacterium]|nr:hypothetical protein [Oligoflexia bacterium]